MIDGDPYLAAATGTDISSSPTSGGPVEVRQSSPVITSIVRYPAKGLAGEVLLGGSRIELDGLPFDRVLGVSNGLRPIEPIGQWTNYDAFHALASRADLATFHARVTGSGHDEVCVEITRRDGETLSVPLTSAGGPGDGFENAVTTAATWFGGARVRVASLVASGTHLWDVKSAPISVINLATIRQLSEVAGVTLDPLRFRANLYIDGVPAWSEFDLVGRTGTVGSVRLGFIATIDRCRATSADPARGVYDLNVPGLLQDRFGHTHCGVYAIVLEAGETRPGDALVMDDSESVPADAVYRAAANPRFAQVSAIVPAASDVASVHLMDPSGITHLAGPSQYVRIHRTGDDHPAWRDYTLSAISDEGVRITVGLRKEGHMSPWIHDRNPGDRVLISGPFGSAVDTRADGPLLILTGGIGITPALALMRTLDTERSTRPIHLIHISPDLETVAHWDEITSAVSNLPNATADLFIDGPSEPGPTSISYVRGRPEPSQLLGPVLGDPTSVAVVCGSVAFTQAMIKSLIDAGVSRPRIHSDPFYPPRPLDLTTREAPLPGPFKVKFGGGPRLTWTAEDGSLLDLAGANGLKTPASCRTGVCGTCATRVDGSTFYLSDPVAEVPDGQILICCAVPTSDATAWIEAE